MIPQVVPRAPFWYKYERKLGPAAPPLWAVNSLSSNGGRHRMQPRFPYRHPEPTSSGGGPATPSEQLGIPDLRLLPTSALVLHEQADEKRVARLVTRVQ